MPAGSASLKRDANHVWGYVAETDDGGDSLLGCTHAHWAFKRAHRATHAKTKAAAVVVRALGRKAATSPGYRNFSGFWRAPP